jgi:hypothetical protein
VQTTLNQAQAYLTCNVTAPVTTKPDFYFTYFTKDRNVSLHVGSSEQKSPDGIFTADATFVSYTCETGKFQVPRLELEQVNQDDGVFMYCRITMCTQ